MRDDSKLMSLKCGSNSVHIDLVGSGGGRLQREIHELEAVLPDPLDFINRITSGVIHHANLHLSPCFE